jgi:multidrug efflux pump subunit AcrA (membrane-fusion protein)
MKKSIVTSLVVLAGLVYVVKHHGNQAYHGQDAVVVEVQKIKSATIPLTLTTVGNLVAAHNIQIAPETAGQVAKILFQDGTFVTKGTPLIQLNNSIYKSRYDSMQADLELSQTTLKRSELLAKKGIISQQ